MSDKQPWRPECTCQGRFNNAPCPHAPNWPERPAEPAEPKMMPLPHAFVPRHGGNRCGYFMSCDLVESEHSATLRAPTPAPLRDVREAWAWKLNSGRLWGIDVDFGGIPFATPSAEAIKIVSTYAGPGHAVRVRVTVESLEDECVNQ